MFFCRAAHISVAHVTADTILCCRVEGHVSSVSTSWCQVAKTFRPKTHKYYSLLFRTFLAFVIYMKVKLSDVDCSVILSFLELLAKQSTSTHMVANYVAAIKAKFMVFGLQYWVLDDPRVRYFLKSLKVNRPLCIPRRNIMDISTLRKLVLLCDNIPMGSVYEAIFLTALFCLPTPLKPHPAFSCQF